MNYLEYGKLYISKINATIKDLFNQKVQSVQNEFLQKYYSELRDYFLAGGKRLRPLLCIAAYNAFTKGEKENIIIPSVGTEFLHNASLIHDDIIDRDLLRRGEPSFHYRYQKYYEANEIKKMSKDEYGNSIGIIGGDSAFFIGLEAYFNNNFEIKLNFEAITLYEQAFIEIANGVLIETDMQTRTKNISMDNYIEMVSLKTGALIEKSILIGATYAQAEFSHKKLLSTYGMNLGVIFQIKDDILGTFGDEKKTGKPIDSDIKEGKRTCLLIEAFNKLESNDKERLSQIMEKEEISDEDVVIVRELYHKADVVSTCKQIADKYYQEAMESLNALKPIINQEEAELFESLLTFVAEREF
ncbi:MAG: Geranylgeranyl diphosphate synthase [Promethearchaeota archaeon]|nr:MAG: Geranylgeranyl diphosphate synthase [Candidatus Lokiarchaeota archaeon]